MKNNIDPKFTSQLQAYLSTPESERDIKAGATLLLQCNPNRYRTLYRTIMRNPARFSKKLEYELNKYLRMRLDGVTRQDARVLRDTLMPQLRKVVEAGPEVSADTDTAPSSHRGKRADHDKLPEEIQALYTANGDLYAKIKQIHNDCVHKQLAGAQACDLYELLKIGKELFDQYKSNWAQYDTYEIGGAQAAYSEEALKTATNYVQRKLNELAKTTDEKKIASLKQRISERAASIDYHLPAATLDRMKTYGID